MIPRKTVLVTFLFPVCLLMLAVWDGIHATEGWGAIGAGIGIFLAVLTILISGILLFLARRRPLAWGYGLLISALALILGFGLLLLVAYFGD